MGGTWQSPGIVPKVTKGENVISAKIGELEMSEKMIDREMVRQDLGLVEGRFAVPAHGGRAVSLLLATQEEAWVALARAQEDAALEAQDALSQADEALVLG